MAKGHKARASKIEPERKELPAEIKKEERWEEKVCKVVRYDPNTGVLGFMFDDIPCQFNVQKGLKLGREVTIKYMGAINGRVKFSL